MTATTAMLTVLLDGATHAIQTLAGQTVLEAAEVAGMDLPHQCRAGSCGTCMAKLTVGEVTMAAAAELSARERRDGFILPCQAYAASPELTISYDDY